MVDYILSAVFIWLAVLTFYFLKVLGAWSKLTKSGKNLNLAQILENIIKQQGQLETKIKNTEEEVKKLGQESKDFFQKHALVRFNPFEDTGGDQSFVIALLNGANNGFVISSLHSRSGTRVYAKRIENSKAVDHEFSKEEKEVVEKAIAKNVK